MTRNDIRDLILQHRDAWARRDIEALVRAHSADSVVESPFGGGSSRGHEAIEKVYEAFFHAFPDITLETDEPLVDGHRAVLIGRLSGTDRGGFMGLTPTGRTFNIPIVWLFDLETGLITRERRIYDFTGLLVQVGAIKAKPA